jgi:LacI family transcriptional regulator
MNTHGIDRKGRRSTISDVAALANVDRSVVSRLINDDPRLSIRDTTRQRVLDAIAMLDYRPHAAARSLRTARTQTLGLLIPDFGNPVYAEIIKGAEQAAARVGSVLVTGSVPGGAADAYLDLLGHGRVDGLLLASLAMSVAQQQELDRLGLPWLLVNQAGRGKRRHLALDDQRAATMAVTHLLGLGHRRIAHIAGPSSIDTARRRRNGYVNALRQAGIMPDPDLIIKADYTLTGGAEAMRHLLQSRTPPTAVFVATVACAIGALQAAYQLSVSIPDQVSVITVHDPDLAACLVPPLTTVRMPLHQLGARAVDLLLQKAPSDDIREVVSEPTELVVRGSTAPPRNNSR